MKLSDEQGRSFRYKLLKFQIVLKLRTHTKTKICHKKYEKDQLLYGYVYNYRKMSNIRDKTIWIQNKLAFKTTKLSLNSFWNVKSDIFFLFHLKIHWSCLKYAFMMLFNLRFEYMLTRFCVYLIWNSNAIGKIVLNKMVIWNSHSVNVIENVGIILDMKWLYCMWDSETTVREKKIAPV